MNLSSFGSCFSVLSCPLPLLPEPGLGLPRRRFSMPATPLAGADMSNRPARVSFTTSPADIAHSMASQ